MKRTVKSLLAIGAILLLMIVLAMPALAADGDQGTLVATNESTAETVTQDTTSSKAYSAAIVVALAAAAGAIGMGWAIAKSVEGISRQPEAEGKIRTTLMLGLVFVETAIIYALVIAILIIFVL